MQPKDLVKLSKELASGVLVALALAERVGVGGDALRKGNGRGKTKGSLRSSCVEGPHLAVETAGGRGDRCNAQSGKYWRRPRRDFLLAEPGSTADIEGEMIEARRVEGAQYCGDDVINVHELAPAGTLGSKR